MLGLALATATIPAAGSPFPPAGPIAGVPGQAPSQAPPGSGPAESRCTPHPPIRISEEQGPDGFILGHDPATGQPIYRPGSGVVDGAGTADDPYVIEGWCIAPVPEILSDASDPLSATTGNDIYPVAVLIRDTTAHVVVRGSVIGGQPADAPAPQSAIQGTGLTLYRASNVKIANNTITGHGAGVFLHKASQVRLETNVVARNDDEGVFVLDSSEIRVADSDIRDNGGPALEVWGGAGSVDARNNWWGAANGPSGGVRDACTGATAYGDGDAIEAVHLRSGTADVCFDPWRGEPNPGAGAG